MSEFNRERPLILFPKSKIASRTILNPRFQPKTGLKFPSHSEQKTRMLPKFGRLNQAFEARRVEITQTTDGIEPEQVLVIETIGSVEDFMNAVKKIDGMEWMFEKDELGIEPDEDFFIKDDPELKLNGRLYMIMTNQQALREVLSLWRKYAQDKEYKFERGYARFREIFKQLKDIRLWDVQDRMRDTGVMKSWKDDLALRKENVKCEIELWFRKDTEKRMNAVNALYDQIAASGGKKIKECIIEDIAYHAVVAELPARTIEGVINRNEATQLIKCESIMFIRPVGQIAFSLAENEGYQETLSFSDNLPDKTEPVLALLDGLPLENHDALKGRLVIDDPDGFASMYIPSQRLHGTAMASLIIHGDLGNKTVPITSKIYVRPIMKPINLLYGGSIEQVPENELPIDIIHRAVKRIFEGESGKQPVAPTIKIINLSVCDCERPYITSISPWARLLDWLSYKYNILFVVSAGNHAMDINTGINKAQFSTQTAAVIHDSITKNICDERINRRLLSPSDTINGLTVGAAHIDNSSAFVQGGRINPYNLEMPSPISAFGPGYNRSIKPDLIYPGGRQFYVRNLTTDPVKISVAKGRLAPGNKAAAPGGAAGNLNGYSFSRGTSNSAAQISRFAAIYNNVLMDIFNSQSIVGYNEFVAPLLKAMVVHGCEWGNIGYNLETIMRSFLSEGRDIKKIISHWIGYGVPDAGKVISCTPQRATAIGFGKLTDGQAHEYVFPSPPSLNAKKTRRRITTTLAWISPIVPTTRKYRSTALWYELSGQKLAEDRLNCDARAVQRGTVQHEIFESDAAFGIHEGDSLRIKVNCRKESGSLNENINYGIVVSLEVAPGIDIPIYDEIRARIRTPIRIESRERI